jgi:hypothetical protein
MNLVLFGSRNPSGAAFLNLYSKNIVETWGRRPPANISCTHFYCDLDEIPKTLVRPIKGILISFAPIWLLAPFLMHLSKHQPQALGSLQGIIACSSSSYATKRFAFNRYDKALSLDLRTAHEVLKDISLRLDIPYQVIAPTMVYGKVNEYGDRNLSSIINLLRILPFILLPTTTGLRQPIHAVQLASVTKFQAEKMISGQWRNDESGIMTLGGDVNINYRDMISEIKNSLDHDDPGRKCKILTIPDKLFYLIAAPLLPINPKLFEAIMRISSDLSGFTMAYEVLNESPQKFPVLPLSTAKDN